MEKCCLIANPVAGNPTHYLVEQAFAQQGIDWRFMSFEIEPASLADAMRGLRALGFHGVKIGDPYHEAVIEHLDELTEAAQRCGSVNSVSADGERFIGDNTEGTAFVELLKQHIDPVGKHATVIGAGRLARAIAVAIAGAGITSITIASRNAEAGPRLVERVQQHTSADVSAVLLGEEPLTLSQETAVVVNATTLGMNTPDAKLPLKLESLGSEMVVSEVAYHTTQTWLTRKAAERGCPVIDGLALYVEQTALALRAWTGVTPDRAAMREAAEEFLGI